MIYDVVYLYIHTSVIPVAPSFVPSAGYPIVPPDLPVFPVVVKMRTGINAKVIEYLFQCACWLLNSFTC